MGIFNAVMSFFGGNNNDDDTSSGIVSEIKLSHSFGEVDDLSTWQREAALTIPKIDLKNCTFEEYSKHQSSVRLAKSFTDLEESSGDFLAEGKSYSEHLEESYTEEVLRKGFFW